MKKNALRRFLSGALVLVMLLALLPAQFSVPTNAAEDGVHVMDATADLTAFAQGDKADGDFDVVNDYFTVIYKAKTKVDGSNKEFDDGYIASQRLNIGGKTEPENGMIGSVKFTTSGPATVKVWWVSGGDGREVAIYDAEYNVLVGTDPAASIKNALYIDSLTLDAAGTYYLGVPTGSNYIFKIEVSEQPAEPVISTRVMDATTDLTAFAQGDKADGDFDVVNDYFTVIYKAKTKVDGSNKEFADGYMASQRLNIGGKTEPEKGMIGSVKFTTSGPATVKVWWVSGGDGREVAIYDAEYNVLVGTDPAASIKNALYIDSLTLDAAGTYYLGVPTGSNYIFKIEVTESTSGATPDVRKAWSEVAAPVITSAMDDGAGNVIVDVSAVVGKDGGDELFVTMFDAAGNELATRRSIAEKGQHSLTFTPDASGEYTFKAVMIREEELPKESEICTAAFKLVLQSPIITSATSKGGGQVEVVWVGVKEAVSYELYAGETLVDTTTGTSLVAQSLQIGQEYAFTVVAIRGEDRAVSQAVTAVVTESAQQTWGFTYYGPSTSAANNGYTGSLNEDGQVTVYSTGGKGKIQPKSGDGLAFYYTAVPTTHNFTLRAKVTVDSWTFSNGQEGFGLMAADKLGVSGDSESFYNNSYLVGATKIEYRYDNEKVYDAAKYASGTKYSMKLGLGTIARTGVNAETIDLFMAGDSNTVNNYSTTLSLESGAAYWEMPAGTYNIVGNYTKDPGGTIAMEEKTTFILEIQKNNTGYFVTYYAEDGTVLCQQKFYGADDLNQLDSEFVYVGFFASRNATATFSDVYFSSILCSEDAPAEEIPTTKVVPTVTVSSGLVTTKQDYELLVDTNVSGTIDVQVAYQTVMEKVAITGGERLSLIIPMKDYGNNNLKVIFTPDPDQYLGENTELSSTDTITQSTDVVWNKGNFHTKVIFVGPDGLPTGNGTRENPYDLHTAVNNVVPGQVIVLLDGVYKMPAALKIERGMDGTEENRIYMIADPEGASRPVLDFQGLYSGFVTGGDYWYFQGFDVANSLAGQKGFQISGNYNVIDSVNAYNNGNTGIQISRLMGSDTFAAWPSYNLVLNCTAYGNCDPGYEDADGFAVKLTVGPGNVLDGCVAYLNADDGYDLYAKNETGPIGMVTIRNSLAYANGYIYRDGQYINAGNGNGFKLGGDSISGYHTLENCFAFYNKSKGIDSNSCPDIQVYNCISYNNGSYNVAFYTNIATKPTDYFATGIISFRNAADTYFAGVNSGEQLKLQGTQDQSKVYGMTNYYWTEGASVNTEGAAITADMFESLTFNGFTRNADGTINLGGFLQLKDNAPAGVGADSSKFSPSGGLETLPQDLEHTFSDAYTYVDNLGHWRECECGAKTDLGQHTLEWIIDQEATPEANGKKHEECTLCGYKAPSVTIYYQAPSTEPTQPATEPATKPATEPSVPATTGGGAQEPSGNNVIIWVIVFVGVAIGAFVIVKVTGKKKEN